MKSMLNRKEGVIPNQEVDTDQLKQFCIPGEIKSKTMQKKST